MWWLRGWIELGFGCLSSPRLESESSSLAANLRESDLVSVRGGEVLCFQGMCKCCKPLLGKLAGAFSGLVMESHQASKLDASGTAKPVISCDMDQIHTIEMVGVPEEHVSGHAFHLYHLTSPDKTVSFEFQHNVCGRSIYAEGTVLFLAKKIRMKAEQRIYNMIDVLREGNMR